MKGFLSVVGGIVGTLLLAGLYVMSSYSAFIRMDQEIDSKWLQVEKQYEARLVLIPNLVRATRRYLPEETSLFEELEKARRAYGDTQGLEARVVATTELEVALARLLEVTDNYPDLKTNGMVLSLMSQLDSIGDLVTTQQERFNDAVEHYNDAILSFPGRYVAERWKFKERIYFDGAGTEEESVE